MVGVDGCDMASADLWTLPSPRLSLETLALIRKPALVEAPSVLIAFALRERLYLLEPFVLLAVVDVISGMADCEYVGVSEAAWRHCGVLELSID